MDIYSLDHYTSYDVDRQHSKEFSRIIQDNKRKKIVLHSLMHTKCKFCASSFSTKGCRNCCLPICNNLTKINPKQLLKNASLQYASGRLNQNQKQPNTLGTTTTTDTTSMLLLPDGTGTSKDGLRAKSVSSQNLQSLDRATTPTNAEKADPNKLPIDEMSLDESAKATGPSAPCLGLVLYNNEEQADVVFLVGPDHKPWRFPAHSVILLEASSFFKDLLSHCDPNNNQRNIQIDWCDPTSFEAVLKYLYTKEISFKSAHFALSIFNASNGLQIGELSKLSLAYLGANCSEENVLDVLSFFNNYLRLLCANEVDKKGFQERMQTDEVLVCLNDLILKCYTVIDKNIETLLGTPEFGNLSWDLVEKLLSRDTLNITTSERVVFDALDQWACQECKRMRKELNDVNKREVLGSLVYYSRYLTMSLEEYTKAPFQSELLPNEERQLFHTLLKSPPIDVDKLEKKYRFFKLAEKRHFEDEADNEEESPEENTDKKDGEVGTKQKEDDDELEKIKLEDKALQQNLRRKLRKNLEEEKRRKQKKKEKEKTKTKKIINRLGDIAICMIHVLD